MKGILEFILRMKDEASAKLASVRNALTSTKDAAGSVNPALGATGQRISDAASGFAKAREQMSRVVGVTGLVVSTFMAAYHIAKPLGEYLRTLWDPVAKGAKDWEKVNAAQKESLAYIKEQVKAQQELFEAKAKGNQSEIDEIKKLEDHRSRIARTREGGGVEAAELAMAAAQQTAELRRREQEEINDELSKLKSEKELVASRLASASGAPGGVSDRTQQALNKANNLADAKIEQAEAALAAAKTEAADAARNFDAAVAEYHAEFDRARAELAEKQKADAKELADKQTAQMRERVALEKEMRLSMIAAQRKAESDAASAALARLSRANEAASRAWEEYKNPEAREARMEREREDKAAEERFRRDLQGAGERASRFGPNSLSDYDSAVMDVARARGDQASAESELAAIAENTKNLDRKLDELLRMKG